MQLVALTEGFPSARKTGAAPQLSSFPLCHQNRLQNGSCKRADRRPPHPFFCAPPRIRRAFGIFSGPSSKESVALLSPPTLLTWPAGIPPLSSSPPCPQSCVVPSALACCTYCTLDLSTSLCVWSMVCQSRRLAWHTTIPRVAKLIFRALLQVGPSFSLHTVAHRGTAVRRSSPGGRTPRDSKRQPTGAIGGVLSLPVRERAAEGGLWGAVALCRQKWRGAARANKGAAPHGPFFLE